jgi:hypothetical protein
MKNVKIKKNIRVTCQITTPKCVIINSGFHWILNEYGHFNLVKLINPLMNRDQLLRTMNYFTRT